MWPKAQNPFDLKLLLIIVIPASFLLLILRSNLLSTDQITSSPIPRSNFFPRKSSTITSPENAKTASRSPTCNKIPTSIAQALIHYTTSTVTPQQTLKEISVTSRILDKKSPCNFIVFGLGHDSLMWHSLNHGSMCQLALKGLPSEVYDIKWELIMVDAPTGYYDEAPGRMTAIYTAGMMAQNRLDSETHVFVHDVNREVEDKFSREFLGEGYMKKQEGRLRHFVIPTHRDANKPFCPLIGSTS